ncbi:hypothetical protein M8818_004222 [Zalaria obscura]|uniref:Uncharacterized protein n=1 Tax=Zalaria obscura TaxID=2024903 RepID=A0ACC3SDK0_9PEZI
MVGADGSTATESTATTPAVSSADVEEQYSGLVGAIVNAATTTAPQSSSPETSQSFGPASHTEVTATISSPGLVSPTIGTQTVALSHAPSSAGLVLPNGETLSPGSATTYRSITISLPSSQTAIFIDTSTVPLPASPPATTKPPPIPDLVSFTIGTQTIVLSHAPSSAGLVLPNGETLLPGSATTYHSVEISLPSSQTVVVVGTSTIPLPFSRTSIISTVYPTVQTTPLILGQPLSYAPSSAGIVLPNGVALAAGSATTIHGTVVSLAISQTAVVAGSSTISLFSHSVGQATTTTTTTTTGLGSYIASGVGVQSSRCTGSQSAVDQPGISSAAPNATVPEEQATNGAGASGALGADMTGLMALVWVAGAADIIGLL